MREFCGDVTVLYLVMVILGIKVQSYTLKQVNFAKKNKVHKRKICPVEKILK